MTAFWCVLQRDLRISLRNRADVFLPLVFFVLVASIFPLGLNPSPALLSKVAPAVIWMSVLLASLLSVERLYRSDFEDGTLEQMLVSPASLPLLLLAKSIAHWLVSGLPLAIFAPALSGLLNIPFNATFVLFNSLLLGTIVLSFVSAIGAALTLALPRGGLLLTLILLPLFAPVIIFGAGALQQFLVGLPHQGQLYFLAALAVFTVTVSPFACAAALRISID